MNNTHHSSLGASPAKVLFGFDQYNHTNSDLNKFLDNIAKVEFNLEASHNASRDLAVESTKKIKEYNKIYYDVKHKKPSQYKKGDYVLIRDSVVKLGEHKQLKPKYKGSYMVSKILNKNRYVIQDIPGFNITAKPYNSILSPDRIKPWVKPIDL